MTWAPFRVNPKAQIIGPWRLVPTSIRKSPQKEDQLRLAIPAEGGARPRVSHQAD